MHARVVRFTDVDPERLEALVSRIEENDGPPEGVPSSGVQVLYDEDQATAVVVGTFANEEDMRTGEAVLEKMDPSDTPGTRASVDRCEIRVEKEG
jgi:hypothetical protein